MRAGEIASSIGTQEEHREAVGRIERLIGAASSTPEGNELDALAAVVDAYERERYPMDAPDPVVAIQFRMEQQQ